MPESLLLFLPPGKEVFVCLGELLGRMQPSFQVHLNEEADHGFFY